MKKILYTAVCMLLFCSACSDSDIEPNPSRQAKRHVTLDVQSRSDQHPHVRRRNPHRRHQPIPLSHQRRHGPASVPLIAAQCGAGASRRRLRTLRRRQRGGRHGRADAGVRSVAALRTSSRCTRRRAASHVRGADRFRVRGYAHRRYARTCRGEDRFQLHRSRGVRPQAAN